MTMKLNALIAIFLFTFGASISPAMAEDASQALGNQTKAPIIVQGIWKVSLAGIDVIMALNQSGQSLFGLAKFEGDDPWNGAVAGSLSGNEIYLSLAAIQGDVLASTFMSGTVVEGSIAGAYVRSESSGHAAKGEFAATMISPDTSGYTPAKVNAVETVQEAAPLAQQGANGAQTTEQPAASSTSKFKDVTQLAKGINPNILPRMAPL
ncbi:MAG: hypothetical protein GYA39_08590 [Methanothrix sp.]|jgi:hypothetical protein|nr:hypothetical protein [Methanothrix sp.]OPX73869.1 MAG: hypothetical protein A4E44_02342 [Methanosaeta sp. PtaB.Bin018]OPY43256.1 MAG: hypothetical protein A4E46_01910 [Methanosaeta sp. PtaU1.Bin016]